MKIYSDILHLAHWSDLPENDIQTEIFNLKDHPNKIYLSLYSIPFTKL